MKKKRIPQVVVSVVCIGLLACGVYFFNTVVPKADPIRHPDVEDVESVMFSCNTSDGTVRMSERYYEEGELVYIEMPCEGIYVSAMELLDCVWAYFTG